MTKSTTADSIKFPDTLIESEYYSDGIYVAGVDEAGRGALAGPVFASAVILPFDFVNNIGLNDSKKVSQKKRNELFEILKLSSHAFSIESIDNNIIDTNNILHCTMMAMHNSIKKLKVVPGQLLIDGNYFKSIGIPYKTIIRGDSKSVSIAAASIFAKVSRDNWMIEVADKKYPEYCFAQHKGYGTKLHYEMIRKYGTTPIHRLSFLKKLNKYDIELFD
jgi:ribonuclease HII